MADLAERYLAEHVAEHNKPSTQATVRRMISADILPRLGSIAVADLNRGQVLTLHREMRATPRHANHVIAVLSRC